MQEKPIIIKWASVQDAQEKQAQRLEDLNKAYNNMIRQKGYPYLYKDK